MIKSENKIYVAYFVLAVMTTVLLMIFALMWVCLTFGWPKSAGEFGDLFGCVNTFFSGLAFLGVIVTVLMQSEELKLQREELRLTRMELQRAAEAQEDAAEILEKQLALQETAARLSQSQNQPVFIQSKNSRNRNGLTPKDARIRLVIGITNNGEAATDVEFVCDSDGIEINGGKAVLSKDATCTFNALVPDEKKSRLKGEIRYKDLLQEQYRVPCTIFCNNALVVFENARRCD